MVGGNRHPLVREFRAGDGGDDVGRESVADVDPILERHFDRPARQRLLKTLRVGLSDRRGRQLLVYACCPASACPRGRPDSRYMSKASAAPWGRFSMN